MGWNGAVWFGAAVLAVAAVTSPARAGTFATITIDGDYSDWAAIPVLGNDGGDNTGGPDIGITKIANDGRFLYIYNSFPNGLSLPTFTSIDVDGNLATGWNVLGLNLAGVEVSWQNDFPFTSGDGVFNDGKGLSGDFFGSGAALLDRFANGFERELAISLDILFNATGQRVFADADFTLLFWTDRGSGADGIAPGLPNDSGLNGDVSAPIAYSLARAVPEPGTLTLIGIGALGLWWRRRASAGVGGVGR